VRLSISIFVIIHSLIKVFVCLFLILHCETIFAQEDSSTKKKLIITNLYEESRLRKVKEFKKITVWTSSGEKLKGNFVITSDSTISIENTEVQLRNINAIRTRTKATKIGTALLIGGTTFYTSWAILVAGYFGVTPEELVVGTLGEAALVTAIVFTVRGQKFDIAEETENVSSEKWIIQIE
jgi:hypothetical protein